jgi:tRNA(Ile)-lysidine synthase
VRDCGPGTLTKLIHDLGRERERHEAARDSLLAHAVTLHPAGFAVLDQCLLLSAPPETAERALSALSLAMGGGVYPPRRRAALRILRMLAGNTHGGYTLAGCRFVRWRGRILVLRELAAAAAPVQVVPGKAVRWDRRFETVPLAAGRPLTLGYLGREGVVELRRRAPKTHYHALPALVYPVLPAWWDEKGLAAVPSLGYRREQGISPASLSFRPVNSLSRASFAVV